MILLLSPRNTASSISIEMAAQTTGWETRRLTNWRAPEELSGRTGLVAYGEPLFVAAMADMLALALIEPPFNWLTLLPNFYTKRAIEFTTLELARLQRTEIFAKPADDKCFVARVYRSGQDIEASQLLPKETPVLLSEVVTWEVEYRFFVLDRQPEAFCIYLRNGELVDHSEASSTESNEALAFVHGFLHDSQVDLPPSVVLDVGKIAGRGWAVLEANPVFGSGIYSCDSHRVLPVLARSMVPAASLSERDKPWVIERHVFESP